MEILQYAVVFLCGCITGLVFMWRRYKKKMIGLITRQRAKQAACDGIDGIV